MTGSGAAGGFPLDFDLGHSTTSWSSPEALKKQILATDEHR
jgi:hypothetical protein